ncbi:MAG: glutamine amidotransferase [Patescibacteria group bacterium]|nr:glutamine amidotransferase [Patescibacteria group bacterium]
MKNLSLTIGWLYPDLMSTYGDRGNIIVLTKRCEDRGIKVNLEKISLEADKNKIKELDLIFMGGAQDKQQEIVNKDLIENKGSLLKRAIEDEIPSLFICGAYQFLGKYYKTAEGHKIPGLNIFPIYTENPGENVKRLIGNIIIEIRNSKLEIRNFVVGFENHGGRTYLLNGAEPFAQIAYGFGNNDKDKTEGVIYKNAIGTYLHGPILPKNPQIADFLIEKALFKKYGKKIELEKLDDSIEKKAREVVVKKYLSGYNQTK